MKIVIVRTVPGEIKYAQGTYNEQYIGLARALILKGHQCDIICSSDDGREKTRVIPVENGKQINLFCVKATIVLKNAILHFDHSILNNYNIIQAIEYNQIYTWHLAGKYKNKFIVYHGPYYSSFNKRYNLMAKYFDIFFLRRYIKNNTAFITKSRMAEDYLRSKGIKNVASVGVGLDVKSLEPVKETMLHSELGEKMDNFKVDNLMLYIGRIEPRRNSLFLIDVLKELRDRGENVGLVVIGKGQDEYVNSFLGKINEYDLKQYILYEPQMEQKYLAEIYGKADVFVLPTYYDIYGMVLLESMYYGLPTVASPCGGSEMMIENWENGVVIDGFEASKWSDAISRILNDKEEAVNMGHLAHQTIEEGYTWDILEQKILARYEKIVRKAITNE